MTHDHDPYDEPEARPEPYRDGRVHVMSSRCSTCVFRPGNPMSLRPGRLKSMTDHVQATGVGFSCHQTLPYGDARYAAHYGGAAICAGTIEAYEDQMPLIGLARQLGIIEEVDPYPG